MRKRGAVFGWDARGHCALTHSRKGQGIGATFRRSGVWVMLIFLGLALAGRSVAALPKFWAQTEIKGAALPFYVPTERKPMMVFRAERVYLDYERRGFFRIGILPLAVAEGVKLEFAHTEKAAATLKETHQHLGTSAGRRRVEMRNVQFLFAGEESARLHAARVRLGAKGQWELLGGMTFSGGTNQVQVPKGTLEVIGPRAGELSWEAGGVTHVVNLFTAEAMQQNSKTNHKTQ